MTALSANADRKRSGLNNTLVGSAPLAASTTIYKHSLVSLDSAGRLITTKIGSSNCVGYAKQKYDNSTGGAGAITGEYFFNDMVEIATDTNVTQGNLMKTLHAIDDNTVIQNPGGATDTNAPHVGIMIKLANDVATVLVGYADPRSPNDGA